MVYSIMKSQQSLWQIAEEDREAKSWAVAKNIKLFCFFQVEIKISHWNLDEQFNCGSLILSELQWFCSLMFISFRKDLWTFLGSPKVKKLCNLHVLLSMRWWSPKTKAIRQSSEASRRRTGRRKVTIKMWCLLSQQGPVGLGKDKLVNLILCCFRFDQKKHGQVTIGDRTICTTQIGVICLFAP